MTRASGPTAVRVAAKAVIIRDGRLLTVKAQDLMYPERFYYALPGGGQEPGENLHDAMRRECLEEIGAHVEVGPLLYVREYIGPNHEYAAVDGRFHQVEMVFACTLVDESELGNGRAPDARQVAVEWLELSRLDRYFFRPRALVEPLMSSPSPSPASQPIYLGDVN